MCDNRRHSPLVRLRRNQTASQSLSRITVSTIKGLVPILGENPKTLVLGSMPSVASLEKQQYYGHPRNAFWPLMAKLLGFDLNAAYSRNVAQLKAHGIVVWDVIGECERPGSLDSAIVKGSERLNPIPQLLTQHPDLSRIVLNGGTAARLFKKHLQPEIDLTRVSIFNCPSTSPANARMNFAAKCSAWRAVFEEQGSRMS